MVKPEDLVSKLGSGWKVSRGGMVLDVIKMEFVHPAIGSYIEEYDAAVLYAKAWLDKLELLSMYKSG